MAPEVLRMFGKGEVSVDGYTDAIDWWSLGISMYKLLVGTQPYTRRSYDELQFIYPGIVKKQETYFDAFTVVFGSINYEPADVQFTPETKDLISSLLEFDPRCRLGNNADADMTIKEHPFFRNVDWNAVEDRRMPAPYIPGSDDILESMAIPEVPVPDSANVKDTSSASHSESHSPGHASPMAVNPVGALVTSTPAINPIRKAPVALNYGFKDMLRYYNKASWMPDEIGVNGSGVNASTAGSLIAPGGPNPNAVAASVLSTNPNKYAPPKVFSKYRVADEHQHYFREWQSVSPAIIEEEKKFVRLQKMKGVRFKK